MNARSFIEKFKARAVKGHGKVLERGDVEAYLGLKIDPFLSEILEKFGGPVLFETGAAIFGDFPQIGGDRVDFEILYGLDEGSSGLIRNNDFRKYNTYFFAETCFGDKIYTDISTHAVFYHFHDGSGDDFLITDDMRQIFDRLEVNPLD